MRLSALNIFPVQINVLSVLGTFALQFTVLFALGSYAVQFTVLFAPDSFSAQFDALSVFGIYAVTIPCFVCSVLGLRSKRWQLAVTNKKQFSAVFASRQGFPREGWASTLCSF